MVNLRKKDIEQEGLKADDKVEGNSAEGRAVFAEICSKLSTKQIGKIAAHRVLKGTRRVTRDVMVQAMDEAQLSEADRQAYWTRYFGGEPSSIAEFVRRRMIIAGGRKEYSEKTDISPAVLSSILKQQRLTHVALSSLLLREPLPWGSDETVERWKTEYETHLMEAYGLNELGARTETLFAMHPHATRTQWVELDNPPASLKEFSANERRKMMSAVRHGRTETWERADRVLVGLGATLKERIHVAKAWLRVKRMKSLQPSHYESFDKLDEFLDDERKRSGVSDTKPSPQNEEEYPPEFSEKSDTEIIAELVRRFTNAESAPPVAEEALDASIEAALTAPRETPTMTGAERSARNAELAMPMAALRAKIAARWSRITELLDDLAFTQKQNLTEKILAAEAASNRIRDEIKRITENDVPERAKAGELLTLLAECDQDAIAIQTHRNTLASENAALVGAFFQEHTFGNYYADVLDFPTRRGAAERGLLRACDTFDPTEGELSTYAFVCMKSQVRREAETAKKDRKPSLDRAFSSDSDGGSLLTVLEDRGVERPLAAVMRSELIGKLYDVLDTLPPQWRRSVELINGLDPQHVDVSPNEAAEIMNAEGLRTTFHERMITGQKVREWVKQAERTIARDMSPYVGKKKGEPEEGLE